MSGAVCPAVRLLQLALTALCSLSLCVRRCMSSRQTATTCTDSPVQSVSVCQALYVQPSDCYNLHWPIQRGRLNIHSNGPNGTLTAVLLQLERIWGVAMETLLDIPAASRKVRTPAACLDHDCIRSVCYQSEYLLFHKIPPIHVCCSW